MNLLGPFYWFSRSCASTLIGLVNIEMRHVNADEWKKYLDAAVQPGTGIAAPFVISEKDVRYAGLHGQIIVFDRLRLMSALLTEGLTLSDELRTELVEWIENLIPTLPQMS